MAAIAGDKKIRAVVVDDEPFARERVRRLLAGDEGVEVVGEAGDGIRAVSLVREKSPDLLFLDVQMPGKDGFGVLDDLAPDETPVVVFLTAYDHYAVRAFERAALDYLLKPFDEERFARAVARAKSHLRNGGPREAGGELVAEANAFQPSEYLERVIVKAGGRVFFIKTEEIEWVEAYGNYVRLHVGGAAYLLRETSSHLEAQLDPERFARIHRSALANVERIKEMKLQLSGHYAVLMKSGQRLTLSRRYRKRLPKELSSLL